MKRRTNGQGSVRRLPSGTFRWQITLGFGQDGKQILKYGVAESRPLAERAKSQAVADRDRGLLPMPSRITLNDWLPKWLDGMAPSLAPKTIANYRYLSECHLRPLLGEKRLQDLKPSDVRSAYQALAQRGYSRSLLHQVRVISSRGHCTRRCSTRWCPATSPRWRGSLVSNAPGWPAPSIRGRPGGSWRWRVSSGSGCCSSS